MHSCVCISIKAPRFPGMRVMPASLPAPAGYMRRCFLPPISVRHSCCRFLCSGLLTAPCRIACSPCSLQSSQNRRLPSICSSVAAKDIPPLFPRDERADRRTHDHALPLPRLHIKGAAAATITQPPTMTITAVMKFNSVSPLRTITSANCACIIVRHGRVLNQPAPTLEPKMMLDAEYWMLDAGYWMLDAESSIL